MSEQNFPEGTRLEGSRRWFLKAVVGIASAGCGVVLGIPLVSSLIGPSLRKSRLRWARVAKIGPLTTGQPLNLDFSEFEAEAYVYKKETHNVWVVKHSAEDVTVFSPICPHLGCRYDWHPERREFICPCHGSVFSMQGKVLAGPAPRPLDTLPKKIESGELLVEWERFETGIPKKVRI